MDLRPLGMVAVALLVTACGPAGADVSRPPATQACAEVTFPPLQGGMHLLGDREPPVPYTSSPPTSGWHTAGAVDIGVHGPGDALTEPEQVSILEIGGVVVTHGALPDADRERLVASVAERYPGFVAVTPYGELDAGTVAFAAWGTLQRCSAVDLDALQVFVDAYADPQPGLPEEHP